MWLKTLIRSRVLLKTSHSPPIYRYISELVEDRWEHAARHLTSIEFSFDPCYIYHDGPRGVGYPADERSVGDSHPSSVPLVERRGLILNTKSTLSDRNTKPGFHYPI